MPLSGHRKQLRLLLIFLFFFTASHASLHHVDTASKSSAIHTDTLTLFAYHHFKHQVKSLNPDSLKSLVKPFPQDSLNALLYLEMADRYLNDTAVYLAKKRLLNENEALNYTYKALHLFSANNDTLGLRLCFNNLASIYLAEKKYSQAKWFILQSNTLSREKHDVANIISSLLTLAEIKIDHRDYQLALSDLDEALRLSQAHKFPRLESGVLAIYAALYKTVKNHSKELVVIKERDSLKNLILKNEQDSIISIAAAREALSRRKLDSIRLTNYTRMQALHKRYWNIFLMAFAVVILVLAGIVFKKYYKKGL